MRSAVLIGPDPCAPAAGAGALPPSDRLALALGLARFGSRIQVYAADARSRAYARACGAERVEERSQLEPDAFDITLVGRGGCGTRGDLAPALLAEECGAALVYEVTDLEQSPPDLVVTRDLGRGARDVLRLRGRSVLLISDAPVRTPYVSQYRLRCAGAALEESMPSVEPDAGAPSWKPTTPRVRLGDHASRVAARAVERMNSLFGLGAARERDTSVIRASGEACARQLFRYLRHNGFIDPVAAPEPEASPAEQLAPRSEPARAPQPGAEIEPVPAPLRRRPQRLSQASGGMRAPRRLGGGAG